MKIILLIDSLTSGGAQRQIIYLANGLAKAGHTVSLVVYHDYMQLLKELDTNVQLVKLLKRRKGFDVRFAFRLAAALRALEPEVLVSFLTGPNFWARLCGPFAGARCIITSVRNTDIERSRIEVTLERLLSGRSTAIVANTESARRQLIRCASVSTTKVAVIRNGVDKEKFRRLPVERRLETRERYNLKAEDFVVVLPGKIEEQKNHLCLIEAIAALGDRRDNVQVLFFGNDNDSALKAALVERIDHLRLSHHIRFCGSSDRMVEVCNMADVVVLPSLWEGLPNVVLEAMACETPVIVSDVADNVMLVDPECGLIFERNNPRQLAEQILSLAARSEEARRKMGVAGRRRIETDFTLDAYIKRFLTLISDSVKP